MYKYLALFYLLMMYGSLDAQLPSNPIGNNAPSLRWNQINTDVVRIIYPEGLDSTAQRVSNIIHYLNAHQDPSIGDAKHKTSIMLQSQAAISNGFVTVGPFRSEFFPAQRQFANATNYIDLLTIHEYRHIQQFANAAKGITKTVKSVLGSWAFGGMMATALPRWYFEGDAVISETEHTSSGRGRLPSFNMAYDALFREDIIYSYEKAGAGSIKEYVPDWYPLGYNILSYGRKYYGDDLWVGVVDDAVRYKGLFFPFSRGLKKRTGLSTSEMYDKTFEELKTNYKKRTESLELSEYDFLFPNPSSVVTSYTMPQMMNGRALAVKSSYIDLATIVELTGDKEKVHTTIGRQLDGVNGTISAQSGLVTWAQLAFDVRWRYRQYSDIYLYNIDLGLKKRLTEKKRYSSPSLSIDGAKIIAILTNEDLTQSLEILSSANGQIIKRIDQNSFGQISHPIWIDPSHILYVGTRDERSEIVVHNIESGLKTSITAPTSDQLTHPYHHNGSVYFSASYTGVNNIYKVSINGGSVSKVTEVEVGAFQPSVSDDGRYLYYVELESNGYKAKSTEIGNGTNVIANVHIDKREMKSGHFDHPDASILKNIPDTEYEVKRFNKLTGLLKPHSLLPQFSPSRMDVRLLSDNVFGTMSASAGASYNYNEDQWSYSAGFNYAELFPIISVSYAHFNRSAQFLNFSPLTDSSAVFTAFNQRWSEDRLSVGIALPFNLSTGNTNANVNLSGRYQIGKINVNSNFDSESNFRDTIAAAPAIVNLFGAPIASSSLSTLDLRFSSFVGLRQARLHLYPRLAASLTLRLRKQLSNELSGGDVVNVNGSLFLPGIAKTHSFFVTGAFQQEGSLDNYRYSDLFNYPRGYNSSLRRDQFVKVGLNYSLPLWYPDIAVGPLAFVKRVKANMFYDYGRASFDSEVFNGSDRINSVGLELGFDFRAIRLLEIDLGLRYSYAFNKSFTGNQKHHQFDFFVISITQ